MFFDAENTHYSKFTHFCSQNSSKKHPNGPYSLKQWKTPPIYNGCFGQEGGFSDRILSDREPFSDSKFQTVLAFGQMKSEKIKNINIDPEEAVLSISGTFRAIGALLSVPYEKKLNTPPREPGSQICKLTFIILW